MHKASAAPAPSFAEALRYWLRLGCLSFGGPAGQIAMMQHEVVDGRRWIDQSAFLRGLNFCMLLPGPEAQQLATYIGWRLHGLKGAVVAGSLFVLPGATLMLGLSWIAAAGGHLPAVAAVFAGIKPVVIAIVLHATWRIGKRALTGPAAFFLAAAAFLALRFGGVDFPWIVAGAGLIGLAAGTLAPTLLPAPSHGPAGALTAALSPRVEPRAETSRLLRLVFAFLMLWAAPVFGAVLVFGPTPFVDVAALFTSAAFVTFGGAYAVLPYVADQAVNAYAWLTPPEMIDGLALAETTPGPLILVLQYVGFFAGWKNPGALGPGLAATIAAALTLWCTFLPSFLFILAGAPHIERLHRAPRAAAALAAITAAVVGVVLNLAVWFGLEVLMPQAGVDVFAALLATAGLALLMRWNIAIHWLVLLGAGAGLARWLALSTLS